MSATTRSTTKSFSPPVTELDRDDLSIQRHFLDLLLQPLDKWAGFHKLEQYAMSALRYQLNFPCFALALAQYAHTPAFTGYLAEAQRNAIEKMRDKRVWSYWSHEHLIGYGRRDPDPISHHNVMYSAFFGAMVGLYETVNDDHRFSESGSLTLRWDKRKSFPYEFAGIAKATKRNMEEKPKRPQYPCEPHLVYPICNTFALNTLALHDQLNRTQLLGDLVSRVRVSYDRDGWRTKSGRFISCGLRSGRRLVPPALFHDAGMATWLHALMPDIAENTWQVLRDRCMTIHDGKIELKRQAWDRLDIGNYNVVRGDSPTRAALMAAAREMGDEEAVSALDASLHDRHDIVWSEGVRQFEGVSILGHAFYATARFGRAGGLSDLLAGAVPDQWRHGPVLAEVAYPDVLVAKAITDGQALDLVLRTGDGSKRTTLAIERLAPNATYRARGAVADEIVADETGRALVEIDLTDRSELRLAPAA